MTDKEYKKRYEMNEFLAKIMQLGQDLNDCKTKFNEILIIDTAKKTYSEHFKLINQWK